MQKTTTTSIESIAGFKVGQKVLDRSCNKEGIIGTISHHFHGCTTLGLINADNFNDPFHIFSSSIAEYIDEGVRHNIPPYNEFSQFNTGEKVISTLESQGTVGVVTLGITGTFKYLTMMDTSDKNRPITESYFSETMLRRA